MAAVTTAAPAMGYVMISNAMATFGVGQDQVHWIYTACMPAT
ncbi:MAG: hypothetical protein OXF78_11310 [Rhodospirillales bacterium]|nr:hypothetical protein [Rhodospirillales bacterium]